MKRLLICVLAIAMMLSSVAFAKNESAYVNFEEKDEILLPPGGYTVNKDSALKIGVEQNGPNSTIAIEADPKEENGQVVKFINPAYSSLNADNKNTAKVVSTFQDPDMVNGVYGTTSNINFGFSFYAPVAIENQTSDVYFYVNFKYRDDSSNKDFVILQTKSGVISSRINKTITKELSDKWYDLRFDIDIKNKVVKTYLDGVLFSSDTLPSALDGVRYATVATVVEESFTNEQEVYFDNFFVNETPECLVDGIIKEIDYGTCYLNDDFSGDTSATNLKDTTQGTNGSSVEVKNGELVVTIGKDAATIPALGSLYDDEAYNNYEYVFETDVNFGNFNSETKNLAWIRYRLSGDTSSKTAKSGMTIEQNGVLKVGVKSSEMKYVTTLEKDRWYNFKFHYKPYNVVNGVNQGLAVDIYFMNNLVAENLVVTGTGSVSTVRNINIQPGLKPSDKERVIKFDNLKFHRVTNFEITPVEIVDLEVCNSDGDLISSTYQAGNNTFTAYVSAASEFKTGSVTLVVARYDSANGSQLIDVKSVPASAVTKGTLTKVTANLNVTDIGAGEIIKVMIIDSLGNLTPYITPIILSSSVQ